MARLEMRVMIEASDADAGPGIGWTTRAATLELRRPCPFLLERRLAIGIVATANTNVPCNESIAG
jgi:hypothetical protein